MFNDNTEKVEFVLRLVIVIIAIGFLIFLTISDIKENIKQDKEPIMTLSRQGNVIINGDTTAYHLEKVITYRLVKDKED